MEQKGKSSSTASDRLTLRIKCYLFNSTSIHLLKLLKCILLRFCASWHSIRKVETPVVISTVTALKPGNYVCARLLEGVKVRGVHQFATVIKRIWKLQTFQKLPCSSLMLAVKSRVFHREMPGCCRKTPGPLRTTCVTWVRDLHRDQAESDLKGFKNLLPFVPEAGDLCSNLHIYLPLAWFHKLSLLVKFVFCSMQSEESSLLQVPWPSWNFSFVNKDFPNKVVLSQLTLFFSSVSLCFSCGYGDIVYADSVTNLVFLALPNFCLISFKGSMVQWVTCRPLGGLGHVSWLL